MPHNIVILMADQWRWDTLFAWMEDEGDYLLYAEHLPPVGSYVDGRGADEQHDPGWPDDERAWFYRTTEREVN